MNQYLHYLGFEMPGLALSLHRVDLGLDQPIVNTEIPLHQCYLTKKFDFSPAGPTGLYINLVSIQKDGKAD